MPRLTKKQLEEKITKLEEELEHKNKYIGFLQMFITRCNLESVFSNLLKQLGETDELVLDIDDVKQAVNSVKCSCCNK
jgi:Tfp pilus assembly protein PilO